jgi:hypothetical protein
MLSSPRLARLSSGAWFFDFVFDSDFLEKDAPGFLWLKKYSEENLRFLYNG